jgi:hypothetical protein
MPAEVPPQDPKPSTTDLLASGRGFYYTKRQKKYEGPPRPKRKLSKQLIVGTLLLGVILALILINAIASSAAKEFDKRLANQAASWILFYADSHDGQFPVSMQELSTCFSPWATAFRKQNPFERPDLSVFQQRLIFNFPALPKSIKDLDPTKPEPFIDVIRLQSDPGKPLPAASHALWSLAKTPSTSQPH